MAVTIATASVHGSVHVADTPSAHCFSVETNGWNRIQYVLGSINFHLLPWATLCGGGAMGAMVPECGVPET